MGVSFFGFDSIPIFTEGTLCPEQPSQIKFFDVYYIYEPVVGIHIVGDTSCTPLPGPACTPCGT